MKQHLILTVSLSVFLWLLPGAGPASGAETAAVGVEAVKVDAVGAASLVFSTVDVFGSADLRISGPDDLLIERRFEDASEAMLDLGKVDGPADGPYRWFLTWSAVVDSETSRLLAEARAAGDRRTVLELRESGRLRSGTSSGSFAVTDGRIVLPTPGLDGSDRDVPAKDFVVADDLIVDDSACIGFDCVDGEDFGSDTIRLKEHRLRIKFEDTSVGGFPSNDWQITVNDEDGTGLNKFSIDDVDAETTPFTLVARAPSHSIYVPASGKVGFGTSTPVTKLHAVTGDTPTLRLEQDGSSTFTPQTWDVGGNEHGFFLRDVTGGSTLPFRLLPGADSEILVVDGDSQVGIGVADPTHRLHVKEGRNSTGELRIVGKLENQGPTSLQLLDSLSGDNWVFTNKPTGFEISKGGTGDIEMQLDGDGNLTILGQLTTDMGVYPDYVFADDYPLMPLDELASFIAARGHLPDIRPESEVGFGARVNLSELSRGLLEKVEELTLYTLQQHETDRELRRFLADQDRTIESQRRTMQDLEARLAALESGR